jgi:hypothetical protein
MILDGVSVNRGRYSNDGRALILIESLETSH